jgi:Ca2+-binding RTX toxin-like protein
MKSNEIKLNLENLEGRIVPTKFTLGANTLAIDCSMDRNGVNYKGADIVVTDKQAVNRTTGQSIPLPATFSGKVVVYGTPANDKIDLSQYTKGPAKIDSYEGNDEIWGTNFIEGKNYLQPWADWISAGNGDDTVYGLDGNDVIYGQEGLDKIFGGAGYDTIYGGGGNDFIDAGEVNSRVYRPLNPTVSAESGIRSFPVLGGGKHSFALRNYYGDCVFGEKGDDVLYARANTGLNPLHGALLVGGDGYDKFDGTTDPNDLQTENIVVAVDYSWTYTSVRYNTKTRQNDYIGVRYETLTPYTYYVASYSNFPLRWYYGKAVNEYKGPYKGVNPWG